MSALQRSTLAATLVSSVLGRYTIVAVPTSFVRLLSDCTAAMFLAQCCFLSEQSTDPEGWFERGHDAWRTELGLSPEQIRRCVRDCAGMVEVKRMGLPSRNFYRVLPEGIKGRLATLSIPETPGESIPVAGPQTVTSQAESRKPVASQTPQQAAKQTPRHSSFREVKKEKQPVGDDVRPTPPVSTVMLTRLLEVWNLNRGDLPEACGLSTPRRKAMTVLLADCDGRMEEAAALLTDATREVAADKFWLEKKFGLDTLLPKVLGKAEAYRSRHIAKPPKATVQFADFGVGQLVTYRRERYAIEAITDRHIDLWDEENGSLRILLTSDDIRSVKPLDVRA